MVNKNVCLFTPYYKDYHSIHTINFVFETEHQPYHAPLSQPVYKVTYVTSGSGTLHLTGKSIPLRKGDIFFTFPGIPFSVESGENFSYMYISFLGSRANMIMDKLKINSYNFLFHDCDKVEDFWRDGLTTHPEISDWISESILLYTFSFLGNNIIPTNKEKKKSANASLLIKRYIDDNISDSTLSLDKISTAVAYNRKYISTLFKKEFGTGVSEYINTLRIQHACMLMDQGFTCISDIATRCGYADAQYFSKIFKKKIGVSPTGYVNGAV